MTMLATVAFPDEIILLCDSRVSFSASKIVISHADKLKKIYQLSQYSMLAFSTDDVIFTSKLIEKMTIKIRMMPNMGTSKFLNEISEYARYEYEKMKNGKEPVIEFIYAGLDFDSGTKVESRKLNLALKKCKKEGAIPDKLKDTKVSSKKFTIIPPPSPILAKQSFPNGELIVTKGWNMGTAGSGSSFVKDLEKYYPKIFMFPGTFNKSVILKNLADEYIKRENIETVGGLVQLFVIDKDGVKPLQYVEAGSNKKIKTYIDEKGNWIEENSITGEKTIVVQNI
jgi:hypothetical protein